MRTFYVKEIVITCSTLGAANSIAKKLGLMGYKVIGVFDGKPWPLVYVDFKFQGNVYYLRGVLNKWKSMLRGMAYIKVETVLE